MNNSNVAVQPEIDDVEVTPKKGGKKKADKKADKKTKKAAVLPAEAKAGKRKTHRLLATLLILMFLVALAAFVFLVYVFNMFALREKAFEFINSINPEYRAVYEYEETLSKREEEIKVREDAAKAEETRLKDLTAQLDAKEVDISSREAALKAQRGSPIYRRPADSMTDQETADMKSLAAVYEKMNPVDAAANILSRLSSTEDMAAVIYFMLPEAAAKVLAQMEPSVAADITNKLLRY
ncbi:MAG: hypothetical protein LBN43_09390 [Oscillospiraceae bacterium]|jgi:flagellar motility protein MotE (MotC chaperone)|nr:hypothetical protein [Oscillospiraceae bacterium]